LQCADRFILNGNGICSPVDPLCNSYDSISGACTTCYLGYAIQSGVCLLASSLDPNCRTEINNTCS
jgi:hypothetical protein